MPDPRPLNLSPLFADGVYFDLPDEDYHAERRLSASGVKWLIASPMDFWARSWMNPRYENAESFARSLGKAYHARILEGRAALEDRFAPALDKNDFKDALVTIGDMAAFMQRKQIAPLKKSAKKEDYVAACQNHPDCPPIWDLLKDEWATKHHGKVLLPRESFDDVEYAAHIIDNHPTASKCVTGGYAEVSIFYTVDVPERDGTSVVYRVPMKARFDYLKLRAIIDLKSFSNPNGMPTMRAIYRQMANYKYHVQAASYLEAWRHALPLIASRKITGNAEQKEFVTQAAAQAHAFWFLFQQSGDAPVVQVAEFPAGTMAYENGALNLKLAQLDFARNYDHFGEDPWIADTPVERMADEEFPQWMFT